MMIELQRTSDIFGILFDPSASRVLMLVDDAGNWSLPHVHVSDERIWLSNVVLTCSGMQKLLMANVTVLRNVEAVHSDDDSHVDLIYVLENHSLDWTPPPQSKWIGQNDLENLIFDQPKVYATIKTELQQATTDSVPALRPPWARAGWFALASAWIREQVEEQNDQLTAPIEQIRTWGISCILHTQTERGSIFFKVCSALPLFCNEPVVLEALSERYPDAVPTPIAIEPAQRWMLLHDFGPELRSLSALEKWADAIVRFGRLQISTIPQVEELLAVGCLDRRLNVLSAQIDPLLADEEALSQLSPEEMTQLQALIPRLRAMCKELTEYAVPCSLVHGDLHSGNITAQTLLFFDWTDACIAHPFFDLSTLTKDVEDYIAGGRAAVVDSYLSQWLAYEPMHRLREIWQLAEPLGALHQAVSYQHILATLEPTAKQQMKSGVPDWLRRMMRTMPN